MDVIGLVLSVTIATPPRDESCLSSLLFYKRKKERKKENEKEPQVIFKTNQISLRQRRTTINIFLVQKFGKNGEMTDDDTRDPFGPCLSQE